jgi:hypothetical protein
LTEDNRKAKSIKESPKNKKSPSSKISTTDVEEYLIEDFANCNYQNSDLKKSASVLMESFLREGELKYIRILSSKKPIYREKVFWDQLRDWNIDAFIGKENAKLLLKAAAKGFEDAIMPYKTKRTGRPAKSLPPEIDIIEEYFKVQQELLKYAIEDGQKKEINKYYSDLEKGKVSKQDKELPNRIQVNIKRRKRNLTTFLQEKKLEFLNTEIDKMVLKSNSEISIQILAKRYNVGIRKIKEQIAIEDPDYKFVVDFKLPNSTIKTIDYGRFCVERIKAQKESKDEDSYFSILSKKLGVPVKLLKTDDYRIHPKQVRTPHKSRVPSKTPSKK